jgi:hypothetical protein
VDDLNSTDVRQRIGLYAGERIPQNERNLTDVRNRVSLIIEYEMARIATRILERAEIGDLFWSYVVANRFPDLEVRHNSGRRGLRVEVKCLQTLAEEKAANFDTLRKDIHPQTDFLVVFLWEWRGDRSEVNSVNHELAQPHPPTPSPHGREGEKTRSFKPLSIEWRGVWGEVCKESVIH